jgi:hypothetical protein
MRGRVLELDSVASSQAALPVPRRIDLCFEYLNFCFDFRGIFLEAYDMMWVLSVGFGKVSPKFGISLFFSLIIGNAQRQTGSHKTGSSARQSGLRGVVSLL